MMASGEEYCFAGIDVGSTTVKFALIDRSGSLTRKAYRRARGRPVPAVLESLQQMKAREPGPFMVGFTGSGGERIASLLRTGFVNEVVAQPYAVQAFGPISGPGEVVNVIEMGGQDSKFMILGVDAESNLYLQDSTLNDLCAAGTGSFLDQQAERLGIPVETLGDLAMRGREAPATIAGRCTVFCKSDMVHLQQVGVPLEKIVAGLCLAVARNFKQTMINRLKEKMGRTFLFQGGVAYNVGMVWAFEEVLGLQPGEILVPEHREVMAALGVAHKLRREYLRDHASDSPQAFSWSSDQALEVLESLARGDDNPAHVDRSRGDRLYSLPAGHQDVRSRQGRKGDAPAGNSVVAAPYQGGMTDQAAREEELPLPVYLGADIGSTTSKAVLLNRDGKLLFSRYLYTEGKPLAVLARVLAEMEEEFGEKIAIQGAGITGSGRHVGGQFLGADLAVDEINAQALGVLHLVGPVDAIIDIGGQDSKYISLDADGVVVDFVMNRACAAGTGTFLEEQAGRLKISIREEFADLAFAAHSPCQYNATCSVFMEQDLVNHQQRGANLPSLVAGLAISMIRNYLRNVAGRGVERLPGDRGRIVFTGGVAHNSAVVSALRMETGREVEVAPYNELTGAIGAAVAVMKSPSSSARFKGFATLRKQEYRQREFVCKACSNLCTVNMVSFGKEEPAYYGARCEKFEGIQKVKNPWEDLVRWREDLVFAQPDGEPSPALQEDREADQPAGSSPTASRLLSGVPSLSGGAPGAGPDGPVVGIPRILAVYDLFPFFCHFLTSLGMKVLLSDWTNPHIAHLTNETCKTTACYPAKLVHGHVQSLIDKGVDLIFLPTFLLRESLDGSRHGSCSGGSKSSCNGESVGGNPGGSWYCNYIGAAATTVRSGLGFGSLKAGTREIEFLAELDRSSRGDRCLLLYPPLDLSRPLGEFVETLSSFRRYFGWRSAEIRKAVREAWRYQEEIHQKLRVKGEEFLQKIERSGEFAIVLTGRAYNLYDPGVNGDVPRILRNLGVPTIPAECLDVRNIDISRVNSNMFWHTGQWNLRVGKIVRDHPLLYALFLSCFGCGPDSFVISFFAHEVMKGKPHLYLEIDDHTASAGIQTRCEAFVNSIRLRRESR